MARSFYAVLILSLLSNLSIQAQEIVFTQDRDNLQIEQSISIHAQTTVISQFKPAFKVPYSGTNSLSPEKETQTSLTSTLYLGARLWRGASLYLNPEIAGGSGLSAALGVGDATNGETFRVGSPAPQVYLARLYYQQLFSLSDDRTYQPSDNNQLAGAVPSKYISFTIGKISIADFFDNNQFSHDPRTQFICWSLMDCGAWDYPANVRGYTPSIVLEYVTPQQELRYGFSLLPTTANGNTMNWNIGQSGAHTLEYTRHYVLHQLAGTFRVLGFYNTTHMGNYEQSISINPFAPDITSTRRYGRNKFGFILNAEQNLTPYLGCFLRAGWNDGQNETWAFTEIDRSISAGLSMTGNLWKRKYDNAGLAFVVSGLSKEHRNYLAADGYGFMLGDGQLNYGTEKLGEVYYSAALLKNEIFLSGMYQLLINPGYNTDRKGPVNIFSVRVHIQI